MVLRSFVKINLLFRIMDPLKRKSPVKNWVTLARTILENKPFSGHIEICFPPDIDNICFGDDRWQWCVTAIFSQHCIEVIESFTYLNQIYSKTCLKRPLKIDKTKVFKTNGSLMEVESIAECSLGAFCNTFDLHYAIMGLEKQFRSSFRVAA